MALQDSVPVTTLERTVSTDFVQAQDLINRQLAEITRAMARKVLVADSGAIPTTTVRQHVASGLMINQVGGIGVTVQPGILCQQVAANPPDVPAPSTFDSTYRFGILMAAEDMGDPWDATNAFWLLQGRVERETTLSENRDIFNPGTLTFAPSGAPLDKRYESQPEFDWKKGTATDIPLPDAGWAPIGYLFRPAGFIAIVDSSLGSISVQLEDLVPESGLTGRSLRKTYKMKTIAGIGRTPATSDVLTDLEADAGGLHCYAKTEPGSNGVGLLSVRHVEAASAAALAVGNTWGYVYLATLPDCHPKNQYLATTDLEVNGVLVTTRTPPDENGQNTIAIAPAAPFTNYVIPIGGASHVGVFRSLGAGAIDAMTVTESGHGRINFRQLNSANFPLSQANGFDGPAGPVYDLSVLGAAGTEDVPYGVTLECVLQHLAIPAVAPVAAALETTIGMGAGAFSDDTTVPTAWPRMMLSTTGLQQKKFWLSPQAGDLTMTVTFIPRTIALINSGGGAADGVGVIEEVGLIGFKF